MFDLLDATTSITTGSAVAFLSGILSGYGYKLAKERATSARSYYDSSHALDCINEIYTLGDGWAGPGSLAPTGKLLDIARSVLPQIYAEAPFAEISPMPNGTIALDWETDNGQANLEIGENNFSFYLNTEDGAFYPLSGQVDSLPVGLGSFVSQALLPSGYACFKADASYSAQTTSCIVPLNGAVLGYA